MITDEQFEELKKFYQHTCLLLDIGFRDTNNDVIIFKYTDYDIPVFDEQKTKYTPRAFKVDSAMNFATGLSVDNIDIVFDNAKADIMQVVINKDQRGNPVQLRYAILNNNANVEFSLILFRGFISEINAETQTVRFTIKHELVYWNTTTLRTVTIDMFPNVADFTTVDYYKWGSK